MRAVSTRTLPTPSMFRAESSPPSPRVRPGAAHAYPSSAGVRNDEAPDTSFWTPYDYFMLDREMRAMRRAFVVSTVVGLIRKLRGAKRV